MTLFAFSPHSGSLADEKHADILPGPETSDAAALAAESLPSCGSKRLCKDMGTCAEAHFYLNFCGVSSLDRDGDGIPCETICGKTLATMNSRLMAQPFISSGAAPQKRALGVLDTGSATFTCGAKRTCRQMTSCEEATFYLTTCGVRSLDGNGDGIACNGLCN